MSADTAPDAGRALAQTDCATVSTRSDLEARDAIKSPPRVIADVGSSSK